MSHGWYASTSSSVVVIKLFPTWLNPIDGRQNQDFVAVSTNFMTKIIPNLMQLIAIFVIFATSTFLLHWIVKECGSKYSRIAQNAQEIP